MVDIKFELVQLQQALAAFDKLIEKEKQRKGSVEQTNEAYKRQAQQVSKVSPGIDAATGSNARLASTLRNVGAAAVAAFAVGNIVRYGQEVLKVTAQFQSMRNAINFASGGVQEGTKNFEFLVKTSEKLGINLESSVNGFKQIQAAAMSAGLSTSDTREVFEGVSTAVSAIGLNAQDAEGIFLALSQSLSKGTVQAEELRGQIGERLPGAFNIAAKSLGVTTQELNKMLEQGKVVASDFLPKFAAELKNTFGGALPQSTQSLQANMERLQNSFVALQLAIGQYLAPAFSLGISLMGKFVNGLKEIIAPSQSMEQSVRNEQRELNALVLRITSVNDNNEERKRLIDQLNKDYPFLLKNVNSETVSNAQLINQLEKVNNAYINRVRIAREQAKIDKVSAVGADAAENVERATEGITRQIAQARQLGAISADRYKQILNNEELLVKAVRTRQLVERDASRLQIELDKARKSEAFARSNISNEEAAKRRKETQALAERLSKTQDIAKALKQEEALYVANKDKLGEVKNVLGGFQKKVTELQGQMGDVFEVPVEEVKNDLQSVSAEQQKRLEEASKKAIEEQMNVLTETAALRREQLNNEKLSYQESRDLIDEIFNLETKVAQIKAQQEGTQSAQIRLQTEQLRLTKERTQAITELGSLESLKAQEIADNSLKATKDFISKKLNLNLDAASKELDAKRKKAQEEIKIEQEKYARIAEIAETAGQFISLISQGIAEAGNQRRQNELAQIEQQEAYKLGLVGDNEQAQSFIREDAEKKRKVIQEKQAKADKAKAIFDIAIQTAINVTKALGTPPVPNFVAAAIAGVLGAAQLGLVASRPLPKFRKGTRYLERGVNPLGIDTIPILANEGERIISTEENARIPRYVSNADIPRLIKRGLSAEEVRSKPQQAAIDYDKLGRAVAKYMPQPEINQVTWNEKGVERWVTKGSQKSKILNNDLEI